MPVIKLRIDNISKLFLAVAVLFTITATAELVYFLNQLPPMVPLYYSLPWGTDRLVAPVWLATLPITSALVLVTNFISSFMLRQVVLTRVLTSATMLVSLLTVITLTKIIFLGLP